MNLEYLIDTLMVQLKSATLAEDWDAASNLRAQLNMLETNTINTAKIAGIVA